ncbi:MAG: hypothetical protein US49_C0007G0033 [candidate division TM6 bacterium GW2011_GWF2_37_49]|nr:MAG: hypothetical protein US49_C0007G0033 [candidate division TM6 bacterium GW2011_GWF2_37_49]
MKCLEELESKVLRLIQKNTELKIKIGELVQENEVLRGQAHRFEDALMKEQGTAKSFEDEKLAIINVVEGLLSTINSLESSQ